MTNIKKLQNCKRSMDPLCLKNKKKPPIFLRIELIEQRNDYPNIYTLKTVTSLLLLNFWVLFLIECVIEQVYWFTAGFGEQCSLCAVFVSPMHCAIVFYLIKYAQVVFQNVTAKICAVLYTTLANKSPSCHYPIYFFPR